MNEYEPSDEEVIAGSEIFQSFGSFPTVVNLARQMGQTYDFVVNMTADEVYMTLLYDFEVSQYEKRLYELKKAVKE